MDIVTIYDSFMESAMNVMISEVGLMQLRKMK